MAARLTKKGILNPQTAAMKFTLSRHDPADDLAFFVERYWLIDWDLRGQEPYIQETLPYPCVNLVIERGQSGVFGVVKRKFERKLQGVGDIFGVKFRVGAFYPFVGIPAAHLTNQRLSLEQAFGADARPLEADVLSLRRDADRIAAFEAFLRARLPARDESVTLINDIVALIISDRHITRVEDFASRFNITPRTLQRLFHLYVGVTPKWVIKRFRLHDAADQLASGEPFDLSAMAQSLGYFDQAHFIKDFKAIVGKTPLEYARAAQPEPMPR